jgi:predicted nucleotidyltransferase
MSESIAEGADKKYTIKKSYTMSKAGVEKSVWHIMDGDFVVDVTDLRRDAKYYADKWNAAEKESSDASQNLHKQDVAEGEQPGKSVTDAIQKVMPTAQEIWFHGSRATGKHRKNSDTDILVVVPDDLIGDQYLSVVRILQKLSSHFDNYDIQPTKVGTNIHRIAQEEGQLLWSNNQGVAEGLDEAVGGNYLYHATGADGLKGILSSGSIRSATGPQAATSAQTKLPTVSVTRDWGYASGSNAGNQMAGIARHAVLVLDRNAIERNFKTLGTSQSNNFKGLALNPYLQNRSQNTDPMARANAKAKAKYAEPTAKAGGEFEEAVVVPKGALPLKGTMVGFWVNPKSELMKDPAIMNDPRRLDMVRPNQFVKATQQQGVADATEGLTEEFDLIESIIEGIAEHNGVDAEAVWADLDSLTEDELYAFAVTSQLNEDWQKANKRDRTDGMSQKAVNAYRRENPGSKLKTAVTTKPSKLKKGGKASKRRKSYCSRSRGQMKMHSISCAKTPDKAICKARRRWNC